MDILKFAMQMETDGRKFYLDAAAKASNHELKEILETLAEEEERHYRIFKSLDEGHTVEAEAELDKAAGTARKTRNVFQQLVENGQETLPGDEAIDIWNEAREIEVKSEKMYRQEADKESDEQRKKLWNKIADEEANHVILADNMIAFLKDREMFLHSAQYSQFQSLEGHPPGDE